MSVSNSSVSNSQFFQRISPSPCKDCKNRELGCHSKCIKYKTWDKDNKEFNKKVNQEKSIDITLYKMQVSKFTKIYNKKELTKSW